MMWVYHATDARGRDVRGQLDAGTESEARAQLRAQQLFLVTLEGAEAGGRRTDEHPTTRGWREPLARWSGRSSRELAILTRAMASLLEAGISLDPALAQIALMASPLWREPFRRMQQRVREGQSLAEAMAGETAVPQLFAPMMAAAEASGRLAATWTALANQVERSVDTSTRVRAALVYPAILGAASMVGTTVLLLVVVPRFALLLADASASLPLLTRALFALSDAVRSGGWLVVPAVLGLGYWRGRSAAGRWSWWLRLPLIADYVRERDAARYLDTLGLALEAGIPLLRAMALARGTLSSSQPDDPYAAAEPRVRDGGGVAEALGPALPPLVRPLLAAGESGGALGAMAQRASAVVDAGARARLEAAVRVLEPVLILGFGGVVGLVALGLLQAVYQLNAPSL